MLFRRIRGSLDSFHVDILRSLDQSGIDNPNTLDIMAKVVPLAQTEFLLQNNDFFELEDGLTFELEDSI